MRYSWTPVLMLLWLGGCAVVNSPSPLSAEGEQRLPSSCRQAHAGTRLAQVTATVQALEDMGYQVRDTDASLGLVSAEQVTRMPGLGAVNEPFNGRGGWRSQRGSYGFRGGYHGMWGAHDPWQVFRSDPVRLERVSVAPTAAGGETSAMLGVTRGVSILMPDGYVRYNALELPDDFCRQLHRAIERALDQPRSEPRS